MLPGSGCRCGAATQPDAHGLLSYHLALREPREACMSGLDSIVVAVALVGCSMASCASAQTSYGTTGLVKIPTAEVAGFGKGLIGGGYASDFLGKDTRTPRDWSFFATVGLVPRVEVGLRLTYGTLFLKSTTDRVFSVKCLLTHETNLIPASALGVQDMIGIEKNFNCLYVVGSKKLGFLGVEPVRLHVGYGTDWWDHISNRAKGHRFVGLFGGVEIRAAPFLSLLAEYDADDVNLGARFSFKQILTVTFNLVAMKRPGCVAGLSFSL